MLNDLAQNLATQYGALGLLIGLLIVANVIQYRRSIVERDEHRQDQRAYLEHSIASTAATVEVRVMIQRMLDREIDRERA